MQKAILCSVCLISLWCCGAYEKDETMQSEWGSFKATISSSVENARNWLARAFGYGQQALSKTQSVEMLSYRYVFLTSFLGGLTAALCVYYLHRASIVVSRYQFGLPLETRNHFVRPTTFRSSMIFDEDDEEKV
jgi:hypothetical protein